MIEKFLEKFLPQITERVNENAEVGKALIEALAVIDNYATLNNVELTEEQINQMLGVAPEPAPEPNADIPAEIVEIVEKKKRGRKPKTTWSWRFKTAQEFEQEYGKDWYLGIAGSEVNWGVDMDEYNMAFLEGQPIKMSKESQELLNSLFTSDSDFLVNVEKYFGIKNPSLSGAKEFLIIKEMFTDKPLPTAASSAQPQKFENWRFKTDEELTRDYGDYKNEIWWSPSKDYLLGQKINFSAEGKKFFEDYIFTKKSPSETPVEDTNALFGVTSNDDDVWTVVYQMVTQDPLPNAATPTTWNWRFKTLDEFVEEYGDAWVDEVDWSGNGEMDYLLGQPIAETINSQRNVKIILASDQRVTVDTGIELGISSGIDDIQAINNKMITDKPLPTAIPAASKSAPKKRGRKPKTAWSWRFKTEQELEDDLETGDGSSWREKLSFPQNMDYLLGQPIKESVQAKTVIDELVLKPNEYIATFTGEKLGIYSPDGDENYKLNFYMITNLPLPTAAAPAKSEPKKRGRKPKSVLPEIDLGGLEDIGDIDIDDIDFDNLVL